MILETLKTIFTFLFGEPHNIMYTAGTFVAVNLVLDFFRKFEPPKKKKVILQEFIKRTLAYAAFLIIANRIDVLAIGEYLGWNGSTQMPVCLYIMAREIRVIFDYMRQQGIDIPSIFGNRLNQMENPDQDQYDAMGALSEPSQSVTPDNIDAKIHSIKQQLTAIEESRKTNNGGENK